MWTSLSILKPLAPVVSHVSGIPGGIFSPSLAVGAGLEANLARVIPHVPAAAMALFGMVAYFAGMVPASITSFVIVMDMSGAHEMLLPLMAIASIVTGVSRLVCPQRLFSKLAEGFQPASASARSLRR